jgi:hypothetical protein
MQAPDPVESILARLMPPALSENGQAEIEEMIDELAGPVPQQVVAISSGKWLARLSAGGGIAAAIGLLGALYLGDKTVPEPKQGAMVQEMASGLILVSESDRVESMTDEGLRENADGSAMRALRLKAVEKNQVLDEESGIVIEISEPREEILLTPVSEF